MNNELGTLYCSSGSRIPNIGHWFTPDRSDITESSDTPFTVVRAGGNFPSYVALQLKESNTINERHQGVYTCVIKDESGIQQTLYVGLYHHGFYGKCREMIV